ncbi:SPOSA6832_01645, partial [Sporobolomyces salmonicolor]
MLDLLSESLKGRCLFAIPKKGQPVSCRRDLARSTLELMLFPLAQAVSTRSVCSCLPVRLSMALILKACESRELTNEHSTGADIQFTRSHRLDVCLVRNHNMALVFLPAADIPRFVGEGNVHLGITGQDMVAEADVNGLVTEVLQLGFGKCKLQVQVPERGEIKTVGDLVGKKVVTSFEVLAGRYFGDLDSKAGLNKEAGTRIEYVGGSVEAACALGLADGIGAFVSLPRLALARMLIRLNPILQSISSVRNPSKLCSCSEADSNSSHHVPESGETMRAAGLHAIETILTSEAVLIRSNKPADEHKELMDRITSRVAGVIAAGKYVLCNYNIPRRNVADATRITPGRRAATVSPLDDPEWVAVSSMVAKAEVASVMDQLQASPSLFFSCFPPCARRLIPLSLSLPLPSAQAIGATDILVIALTNCRV